MIFAGRGVEASREAENYVGKKSNYWGSYSEWD